MGGFEVLPRNMRPAGSALKASVAVLVAGSVYPNFTVLIHLTCYGPCRTHLILGDLAVLVHCGTGSRESGALVVPEF